MQPCSLIVSVRFRPPFPPAYCSLIYLVPLLNPFTSLFCSLPTIVHSEVLFPGNPRSLCSCFSTPSVHSYSLFPPVDCSLPHSVPSIDLFTQLFCSPVGTVRYLPHVCFAAPIPIPSGPASRSCSPPDSRPLRSRFPPIAIPLFPIPHSPFARTDPYAEWLTLIPVNDWLIGGSLIPLMIRVRIEVTLSYDKGDYDQRRFSSSM
jgi:hypothetical protein